MEKINVVLRNVALFTLGCVTVGLVATEPAKAADYDATLAKYKLKPVTEFQFIGFDTSVVAGRGIYVDSEIKLSPIENESILKQHQWGDRKYYPDVQMGAFHFQDAPTLAARRMSVPMMIEIYGASLAKGGQVMAIEMAMTHPELAAVVDTRRATVRTRYNLRFTDCDGERLSGRVISGSKQNAGDQIAEIINGFQELGYKRYFRCGFYLTGGVADAAGLNSVGAIRLRAARGHFDRDGRVVIAFGTQGESIENERFGQQVVLEPRTGVQQSAVSAEATKAAKRFIRLIKEHGNILIENNGLSEAEVSQLLQTSITDKKPEILQLMQTMNDELPKLTLIDQFTLVQSVNGAYEFLKELEAKVGQLKDRRNLLQLGTIIRTTE